MIDALGFAATVISFALWLPQALSTYRNRHDAQALSGLSVGTFVLVLVNATLWGLYAVLTGAFWAGAPGIVNFPLAAWTLWLIWRSRRPGFGAGEEGACACGFASPGPHDFVVTAPPGYGYVHSPCTGATRWGFVAPFGAGEQASRAMREVSAGDPLEPTC